MKHLKVTSAVRWPKASSPSSHLVNPMAVSGFPSMGSKTFRVWVHNVSSWSFSCKLNTCKICFKMKFPWNLALSTKTYVTLLWQEFWPKFSSGDALRMFIYSDCAKYFFHSFNRFITWWQYCLPTTVKSSGLSQAF